MKKRLRRAFAFLISIAILVCCIPNISAQAATQSGVTNQLNTLISQYAGRTATSSQMYMGSQCKGFANWVFKQLFGVYIGPYPESANYKISNANAQLVGMIDPGGLTESTAKALLQKAKPGDYIQVQRSIAKSGGRCGPHSMIVVDVKSDGVQIFDCNSDGRNTIKTYLYTWSEFDYDNRGMSLYHAWNYSVDPAILPGTVDSSWNVPVNVTATRKLSTYDQYGNVESNRYISAGDSCYISEVYTNGFVKIQYPTASGTRWAYAKAADFSLSKKSVVTFGTPLNIGTNFYAYIQNPNAGKCLTNDNQNVSVRTYSETNDAQVWKFERQSDGSYKIINNKDGLLLDVLDSGTTDYTNVQVWKDNGADAQRWFVYSNGNAYLLRAKCADLVLDVYGAGTAEGTNVELYTPNGTNAQVFSIIKTEQVVTPSVEYSVHVQDKGWTDYVSDGTTAGTTGQSLQMEAIKIKVNGMSGDVVYRTHVEDYGWMSNKSSGSISGTTGKNLQIEAIQIYLTGKISESYDVYYRAHIADFGWLGWTKNGETAGSTECALQMEAIQIKLCPKNSSITTSQSSIGFPQLSYKAHVSDIGWQNYVSEGTTAGTTGRSLQMEALEISCKDFFGGSGIQYCAHVADVGWQDWKNSDTIAGTTGQNKKMEAIKIKLSGYIANYFDVYYRVHCADYGWLGWACNGESAGTTGGRKQMEAIQIKIIRKGNGFDKGGTAYYDLSSSGGQSSSSSFDPIWPCEKTYKVTTLYRYSSGGLHSTRFQYGIDIGASKGENVLAVEAGTVIKSEYSTTSGFGNWIMIQHDNGKVSLYAHLNRRNVSKGDKVAKGQVIGQVGNTSAKYRIASHLHFELGNSSRSGASGDAWQEYYKAKYADKVEVCCTETK